MPTEPSESWLSAPKGLSLFALSPLVVLYWWFYPGQRVVDPNTEAPYLVSPSWFCLGVNHIRSFFWNDAMTQRGYNQYKEGMFKMPYFGTWMTVVGPKYVDEIARAPGSSLSFRQNLNNQLQLELLVGPALSKDQVHLALIRTLNRNLDAVYIEIAEETEFAVIEALSKGKKENDWVSLKGYRFVEDVITRLNYRAMVGLPQCRDDKWTKAIDKDMLDMTIRNLVLRAWPESKRATINWCLGLFGKPFGAAAHLVAEAVEARLALPVEERSNNMLSWILTRVPGEGPDARLISGIFQLIRGVAQGTTSMSFGHALFHLVAHPECVDILREDITQAMEGGELTFKSLDRMHRLDSFLHETQRMTDIGNFTLGRVAVKDFHFSNGVCIREGELVQAMSTPMHHDAAFYPDPLEFKPWRNYDLRTANPEGDGTEGAAAKYDMVTPSNSFLVWGLGRHACPGRWYATMVLKHLMAYLLLNYDMKLPESAKGKRPKDLNIASIHIPNTSAQILFKRRGTDV